MKTWPALDIRCQVTRPQIDDVPGRLAAFLDDYRPSAIVELTDHAPPAVAWRVFFASASDRQAAALALAETTTWMDADLETVDVPDEQWAERSQAALTAIQVDRVVVTPPWDLARARAAGDAAVVVVIEPSMGFGTGHHESTRLCLRALQRVDVRGSRVVDLGTGSGVLAITAALLGCVSALALDDDPDAVTAAEENVTRNQVGARVEVRRGDLVTSAVRGDVVLGNLTGALLRRHADQVRACVEPGGTLILSGFTEDERLAVVHAFEPFKVVQEAVEHGWLALTFVAPS